MMKVFLVVVAEVKRKEMTMKMMMMIKIKSICMRNTLLRENNKKRNLNKKKGQLIINI